MKPDLSVNIASIKLKNPVLVASGTFGYGDEIRDLVDVSKFGAIITKTITLKPKQGNPPPRLAEVTAGILNTIGLQNVGLEKFVVEKLPHLLKFDVPVIVSIAGETSEEYVRIAAELNNQKGISAIELNLSCPNLQKKIICRDSDLVADIVKSVLKVIKVPIITKLSPQVVDLAGLALLCEISGASAISVVNTFPAMAIDIKTWKPKLSTITGGLSGPCIKPIALKCVWDVYQKVKAPIIGGGGIMTSDDAIEFFLAGATAVSVGTANFINPNIPLKIVEGIRKYMESKKMESLKNITGKIKVS